jgi:hypothetical protein
MLADLLDKCLLDDLIDNLLILCLLLGRNYCFWGEIMFASCSCLDVA